MTRKNDFLKLLAVGASLPALVSAAPASAQLGAPVPASAQTFAAPLLAADGLLRDGQVLRHDSIVGTTFLARVVGETPEGLLGHNCLTYAYAREGRVVRFTGRDGRVAVIELRGRLAA